MPTLIKMGCEAHCASELDHLVDHQTKDAQRLTRQNNGLEGNGGDDEDRTHDLRIANATLSQLSYVPTGRNFTLVAEAWPLPTRASAQ